MPLTITIPKKSAKAIIESSDSVESDPEWEANSSDWPESDSEESEGDGNDKQAKCGPCERARGNVECILGSSGKCTRCSEQRIVCSFKKVDSNEVIRFFEIKHSISIN
jgi:hypothetical protein